MNPYLEAITSLGFGNLHPGGFSHSVKVLRDIPIASNSIILDVGCGTGKTACYLSKTRGAHIFGLDISQKMIEKAKARNLRTGAEAQFIVGNALDMPFRDKVADIVLIESLLIFLPAGQVLKECRRVLKTGGIIVDIEMTAGSSLPDHARQQIKRVCGLPEFLSLEEYASLYANAGFKRIRVERSNLPGLLDSLQEALYMDRDRTVAKEKMTPELVKTLLQYKLLIFANRKHLEFGTFIYKKS
ncbi:MAG: Demethylmenaquinone methyltransferase [Firmicutes bacterium ADurb.Bin373]|nr:class I SAM-dependent methyltransferase [Bacillota bacterium]OQA11097.1 MAG: Demethylmenaquinone methyltransferase [Firmicutes bacterium ADurb.Bin373]